MTKLSHGLLITNYIQHEVPFIQGLSSVPGPLASCFYITNVSAASSTQHSPHRFQLKPNQIPSFSSLPSIIHIPYQAPRKMINTRKLIKIARKWQKRAANGRKRLSFPGMRNKIGDVTSSSSSSSDVGCSSPVAEKGHFVLYTVDKKRYSIPIAYINNCIFRELFKLAEEEFGLPCDGPITIPFDAVIMDYLVSIIKRGATNNLEKALLTSIAASRCSSSYISLHHQEIIVHHQLLLGF